MSKYDQNLPSSVNLRIAQIEFIFSKITFLENQYGQYFEGKEKLLNQYLLLQEELITTMGWNWWQSFQAKHYLTCYVCES